MKDYYCPESYKGPQPIAQQIRKVAKMFDLDPERAIKYSKKLPPLHSFVPSEALKCTGWFAIPMVKALAAKVTDRNQQYCETLLSILATKTDDGTFSIERKIEPALFQMRVNTAEHLAQITRAQGGSDILIVAAQIGKYHVSQYVETAKLAPNECGLWSVAGCTIALTHPERFAPGCLGIICSGDQTRNVTDEKTDGKFVASPVICYMAEKKIRLIAQRDDCIDLNRGMGSVFIP
ncbi:MAG: hypothetical protein PHT51_02320 [Patescibacteria group bacterium]|nr:hypothetical protein [Patescibacteria group bacterium]MDD4611060.1 hypothetical protein [Patescibacteria group bacterium]